ncbi:MAG: EVE domain-containing protein [Proteobacteria bacterium]|nr:EVE domain-containing protein [Pseudomonadota bacterium]MBS0465172.1 EVE domain-containing protein [Pseudomonadota bacterium]
MNHWLVKSEPDEFSIDALARVGVEPWSGVRNYQARNHLRAMQVGDGLLFYHSSCAVPGVVGVARVAKAAYADPTQFDPRSDYHDAKSDPAEPRWSAVDVAFVRKLARAITLDELRAQAGKLGDFALLNRGNRLSVLPLSARQWKIILSLE